MEADSSEPTPRERPVALVARSVVMEAEAIIARDEPGGISAIESAEEDSPARKQQRKEIAKVGRDC